ncbi:hypothetical protein B0T17DRAFT_506890 [Bombardia bombarda]|uniref:Uncharacterized protein n=1 Tax=Bombardia bombarda TaxID=252184 RepID=A0AA39XAM4_9PEZI|nr:hypothetical protein B0T17DRAFT_506890 [Bombardia bombarda]
MSGFNPGGFVVVPAFTPPPTPLPIDEENLAPSHIPCPKPWERIPVPGLHRTRPPTIWKRVANPYPSRLIGTSYVATVRELETAGQGPRKRARIGLYYSAFGVMDYKPEVDLPRDIAQELDEARRQTASHNEEAESLTIDFTTTPTTFPEKKLKFVPRKRHNSRYPIQPKTKPSNAADLQPRIEFHAPAMPEPQEIAQKMDDKQMLKRSTRRLSRRISLAPGEDSPRKLSAIHLSPGKRMLPPVLSPMKRPPATLSPRKVAESPLQSFRVNATPTKVILDSPKLSTPTQSPLKSSPIQKLLKSSPLQCTKSSPLMPVVSNISALSASSPTSPDITPLVFDQPIPELLAEPEHESRRRVSLQSARRIDRRSSVMSKMLDLESVRDPPSRRHSFGQTKNVPVDAKSRRVTMGMSFAASGGASHMFAGSDGHISAGDQSHGIKQSDSIPPPTIIAFEVDVGTNLDIFGQARKISSSSTVSRHSLDAMISSETRNQVFAGEATMEISVTHSTSLTETFSVDTSSLIKHDISVVDSPQETTTLQTTIPEETVTVNTSSLVQEDIPAAESPKETTPLQPNLPEEKVAAITSSPAKPDISVVDSLIDEIGTPEPLAKHFASLQQDMSIIDEVSDLFKTPSPAKEEQDDTSSVDGPPSSSPLSLIDGLEDIPSMPTQEIPAGSSSSIQDIATGSSSPIDAVETDAVLPTDSVSIVSELDFEAQNPEGLSTIYEDDESVTKDVRITGHVSVQVLTEELVVEVGAPSSPTTPVREPESDPIGLGTRLSPILEEGGSITDASSPSSESSGFTPINARQVSPLETRSPMHQTQPDNDFTELVGDDHHADEDVMIDLDDHPTATVEEVIEDDFTLAVEEAPRSDNDTLAMSALHEDSETEMLRKFVTRVTADKNAKAAAAAAAASSLPEKTPRPKRRSGSTGSSTTSTGSPIAKSDTPLKRTPLGEKSLNSPSLLKKRKHEEVEDEPAKDKEVMDDNNNASDKGSDAPRLKRRRKRADPVPEPSHEDSVSNTEADSSTSEPRRSTRARTTRVALRPSAPSANAIARARFPVRFSGPSGAMEESPLVSHLVMSKHRSDGKDLATFTRVNTRKNKQDALMPKQRLEQLAKDPYWQAKERKEAVDAKRSRAAESSDGSAEEGNVAESKPRVRWAETLASFQVEDSSVTRAMSSSLYADVIKGDDAMDELAGSPEPAVEEAPAEKKAPAKAVPTKKLPERKARSSRLQVPTPIKKVTAEKTTTTTPTVPAARASKATARTAAATTRTLAVSKAKAEPAAKAKAASSTTTSTTPAKAKTGMATKRTKIASLGMSVNGTPAPKRRGRPPNKPVSA